MRWFWIVAVILLGVAAFSVWYAFSRPDFVAGLIAVAGAAAWKAIAPQIGKRMSPEEEAEYHQAIAQGRLDEWRRERFTRRR